MRLSWKPWERCAKQVAAARASLAAKKAARCGFGQADRLHTLRAADEQVVERLQDLRRRWEESAVKIYSA